MRRRFMNSSEDIYKPFYIEALEDGVAFSFGYELEYRVDGGEWITLPSNTFSESINKGSRMYISGRYISETKDSFDIRGLCKLGGDLKSISYANNAKDITTLSVYGQYWYLFRDCTSIVEVESNLLSYVDTLSKYCYDSMFYGCTSLVNAPELPAIELDLYCYSSMFYGCTSLVNAPELPAIELAGNCYSYMFNGCTSLVNAPELPAIKLAGDCYSYMFNGCTKLNYIKALFTTIPSGSYTSNWVKGVASSGTFVKNKNATWDVRGVNGIPTGWTIKTE